jgi:hypothetical protein
MKLLIAFLLVSFFLGYATQETVRGRHTKILAAGSILLGLIYLNYLSFW